MVALLRAARWQLPVIAIAAAASAILLVVAGEHGAKLMALVVGLWLVGAGAFLSGGLRLFCLWGFILSLPFDLSYRFGPILSKLGGETSFRIELSDLFWVPLLAFLVRDLVTGRLRGVRIPKVTFVWFAIMAVGMWAMVVGPWRITALHEVVRMGKIALMFIVVVNELRIPGRVLQVAMALATALLIQAAAGVAQFVTGSAFGLAALGEADVRTAENVVKGGAVTRVGAFLVHPVIFATFLATMLPVAFGLVLVRAGRWRRLLFAAAVVLGVPALILTLSRAGWLTFAVGSSVLAALIMFRPSLRRKALIPLAVAATVMAAVGIAFSGAIMTRLLHSNPESEMGRAEWAQDAGRMIAAKPLLGFGLNSYTFSSLPYSRLGERGAREFYEKSRITRIGLVPVVHNAYLQWLAEMGIVGFSLHLAIFAMLLHTGWRNLRVQDELLFVLNAACTAALVGYLVDLSFGNSLRQGSTLREFWVLAALVCGIHYWRLANERPAASAAFLPAGSLRPGPSGG